MVVCKCMFLDGKEVDITVDRNATGADLFNSVCKYLNIHDKNPLGLVHRGGANPSTYNWWIRHDKPLRKQITGKCQVWAFALILKFYPINNFGKHEDITRYYMVLQVRDDLLTGRLTCQAQTMAILASYWLQSEYGAYKNDTVDRQLADAFHFVRRGGRKKTLKALHDNDIDFEEQMIELHRDLGEMSSSQADMRFLKLASSLPKYGMHFYPAIELPAHSKLDVGSTNTRGNPVSIGLGVTGILVDTGSNKTKLQKRYSWEDIRAVSFKRNSVTLKLNIAEAEKKYSNPTFVFEDMTQAKTVWRAAIDLHVNFRVKANNEEPQEVSIKLKRKWSVLGKKEAKMRKKGALRPVARKPKLSVIAENSPNSVQGSHLSLHQSGETVPKEVEAEASESDPKDTKKFPALPLKAPRSPSIRSHTSRKSNSQPPSKINSPALSPRSVASRRERAKSRSRSSSPSNRMKTEKASPSLTARFDDKVASAVPPRLRSGYTTSQTSTAGEEILSDVSDNTDMLCSSNIIEKAFSYAEEDGINNIKSWLELCTPRERHERRGRPISRSAPASQRSRSRGRSPLAEDDIDDINDYKPLIRSKHPISIKAKNNRDLSPPLTVHYEDEPVRRRPARYQSADNVARKDWTLKRQSQPVYIPTRDCFDDVYRREYLNNVSIYYDPYRRARSMYSLTSRNNRLDRSPSSDYHRSLSPSTVSAHASSGSRRSFGSYFGTSYDDDLYRTPYDLPVESTFTRRVMSESKLAKAQQSLDNINALQQSRIAARQRRRNVTSWALGDRDDICKAQVAKENPRLTTKTPHRNEKSVPTIPRFIRSVR